MDTRRFTFSSFHNLIVLGFISICSYLAQAMRLKIKLMILIYYNIIKEKQIIFNSNISIC